MDDWEWHARMSAWEEEVDARAEAAIARRNERALLGKPVPTFRRGADEGDRTPDPLVGSEMLCP
jgi:hypothetical protein